MIVHNKSAVQLYAVQCFFSSDDIWYASQTFLFVVQPCGEKTAIVVVLFKLNIKMNDKIV